MGEPLTAEERATLKTAAFGAVFLLSNADPGLLSMIKESFAASGVIAASKGLVKDVLTGGDLPELPRATPAEVERIVLPGLRRSMEILRVKAPQEVDNYRITVIAAVERVAQASAGVNRSEATMMAKVKDALGADA